MRVQEVRRKENYHEQGAGEADASRGELSGRGTMDVKLWTAEGAGTGIDKRRDCHVERLVLQPCLTDRNKQPSPSRSRRAGRSRRLVTTKLW